MKHKGWSLKTYKSLEDAKGVSYACLMVPCTTKAVILPSMGTKQAKCSRNGQEEV